MDSDTYQAQALWYIAPDRAELRPEMVKAPAEGEVLVRALHSGISRGTEALVLAGRVPASEYERMRGPHMGGSFPFPVKYGYSMVGRVEEGADALAGRSVFVLHPHQSLFAVAETATHPVPEGIPPGRAVLAANVETALNALWDSGAAPGDRIAVVGGGTVGLLVAWLCGRLPGAEVTVVDIDPGRAALAASLGVAFARPPDAPADCDVVFHASATTAGLATAIASAGFEAAVVEMSWFGEGAVAAPLGGAFHSRRLRLISSQVGQVAPSHRPRWDYRRRLTKALDLLADARLDALIAPPIRLEEAPDALPRILAPGSGVLCQRIDYPPAP